MARQKASKSLTVFQANGDADAGNIGTLGRFGKAAEVYLVAGNVLQPALFLEQEVMMSGEIGVETGQARGHADFPQQPGLGELVEGIVDGGPRDAGAQIPGFLIEGVRRYVTVAFPEQQLGQNLALARGTDAVSPEVIENGWVLRSRSHGGRPFAVTGVVIFLEMGSVE